MGRHIVKGAAYIVGRTAGKVVVRNAKGQYVNKATATAVKSRVFGPRKYDVKVGRWRDRAGRFIKGGPPPKAKPKYKPKGKLYEYTAFSTETGRAGNRKTFEARQTMRVEGDPASTSNVDKAMRRFRSAFERLKMPQITDILERPSVQGIRPAKAEIDGVQVGDIKSGMMYTAYPGGRANKKLVSGVWRQTKWIFKGKSVLMELVK